MSDDVGKRVAEAMKAICEEIPGRVGVQAILADAYARLSDAADGLGDAREVMVSQRLTDVLREIATHAVEEFTRRTGQPFLWVDEPEWDPETDDVLMSMGVDEKGNVVVK